MNLVTRSGTNDIHGSLYDFLRNTDLNANSFFNNKNGLPRTAYQRNNFGGTVNGPIIKDRLFYFFDYDGIREISPAAGTFGVPSLAERNGNFGELCGNVGGTFNAAGQCSVAAGQIWDPYSAVQNNTYGNGGLRTQFIPFNNLANYASANLVGSTTIVPNVRGNLINPITQRVMSFYPLPNIGVPGTRSYNPYSNYYVTSKNRNNNNQYDIKLDSRFTDSDQLSVRFSYQWGNGQLANLFGNALDAYTQGPTNSNTYAAAVNYNHIFSPRTLLAVTVGFDHNFVNTAGIASQYPNVTLESLGFSTTVANQLRQSGFRAFPAFNLDQYSKENGNASIGSQPYSGLIYGRDVYHFIGSVGHTIAGHDLRMGAEYRVHRINFAQFGQPAGLFGFGQGGTSQYQSVGGDSMATFLTGFANNWSAYENPVTPATQSLQYGGFIQDNWHVNDRLTLNLGVRYDIDHPRTERYNQMSYFDLNAPSPLAGVPGVPVTGSVEYVGQNGNSRNPYATYYGAVGPRFGFAYRIGEKNVVRGGYGIYYGPSKYGAAGTGSGTGGFLGFSSQPSFASYNSTYNYTPNLVVGQPLNIPPKTGNSQGVNTNLGGQLPGIPIYQFNKLPQEQSWSFGIQRQLPFDMLLDLEYVGRKGTHLYLGGDTYAVSHLPASAADAFRANPGAFNAQVPVPAALASAVQARTAPFSNGLWNSVWPAYNAYLPYPQYPLGVYGQTGFQNQDPPIANSIYHGFQMRLDKRFSKGLQFLFTYSAQKSIDNSSTAGAGVYINGYTGATLASIQDPNNLRLERSLSAFDVSQVAQFTALYELPFGRGRMFGSNWNRWVNGALGGWQVNAIYRWDTGLPLLLFLQGGVALPTYGSQRPNLPYKLIASGNVGPDVNFFTNGPTTANIAAWIPAPYYDGNAPRVLPNVRQQGTNNVTASLFKQFAFTERIKLELRGEAFNLLNRVQFDRPSTTIGASTLSTFGVITGQANQPRTLQVAMKLYF